VGVSVKCVLTMDVVLQWNPVNTATNGPWKFGRINGVGSNFMAGLLQVTSLQIHITIAPLTTVL